jgi:hypothetical protein
MLVNSLSISKLNLLQLMNVPYQSDIRLATHQCRVTIPINTVPRADQIYDKALHDLALVKAGTLRTRKR